MRRAARAKEIIESIAPPIEIGEQVDNVQQLEEDFVLLRYPSLREELRNLNH